LQTLRIEFWINNFSTMFSVAIVHRQNFNKFLTTVAKSMPQVTHFLEAVKLD